MTSRIISVLTAAGIAFGLALGLATPAGAQRYNQELRHSVAPCQGEGPAVWMRVMGIKNSTGNIRVNLYRGTAADWMESGRWLNRIEMPAREGTMMICMPVPEPGNYAIAIRHDANNNGKTDITSDGGGMSNNPRINIFNLGRPGVDKTRFSVGRDVVRMNIRMRYL